MKQKIYILGFVTALIISLGAIFKVNHWPAAGHLLILGIFTLVFVFLPVALRNNYKAEGSRQNLILYWVTWLTCFVVFIGMLFKILHWPHAGFALLIALPFPYVVFLPVFLVVTAKNKNFNIYNTVFVLFLLTAISAVSLLLALSVSKERIADSLTLAGNYNRMEIALQSIPANNRQSAVNKKIDDIIKTSGEYKDLILRTDGITVDQWNNDPKILLTSDSWQLKRNKLMEIGLPLQIQLKTGLSDLLIMLEKTPGYESLAKAAPSILDMEKNQSGNSYNWKDDIMIYSEQPWSLIYLDGLTTNLKIIKALTDSKN
jgi:hypothetical protein